MLREHQLVALILSLHDSFSSSKAKLAPPASFTRPLARRPPFSMGMIAWASLVGQLLARREGDVPLAHGGAHGGAGGPRSHLLGRPSCERAFFRSPGEQRENPPKFGLGVCVEVPSAVCPSGMRLRVGAHHREGGGATAESYGEAAAGSLFCG